MKSLQMNTMLSVNLKIAMSKYISADKLIAEIERLRSLENSGRRGVCVCLLSFIESLEKEQPQGIDEAAEEYTKLHVTIFPDSSTDRGTRQRAFKAGAKFQAEQGYSREVEVKEDAGGYPYINEIELYDYDNDKPLAKKGDKVRIQITKL